MHKLGHFGAALLLYAPVGVVLLWTVPELAFLGGAGVVALSTLPDLDHRLPLVAHRGATHTVGFLLLVALALAGLCWSVGDGLALPDRRLLSGFGALVGGLSIGSHILADALTPMGVRPFWPLSRRRYTLRLTKASDPVANWLLLALGVAAAALALAVGGPLD